MTQLIIKEKEEFNLESMRQKALEQIRSGQSLYGKDRALSPLLKHFLELVLDSALDNHLDESERSQGNRKNGKVSKHLKTSSCTIDIETSRDRLGNFEPELIKKRDCFSR